MTTFSMIEKEPGMGLFSLKTETLIFPVSSTGDKWGRIHSFTLLFFYYLIFDLLFPEWKNIGIPPPGFTLPLTK